LSDSSNPRDPEVEELSPFEKDLMDKLFSNPRLWPDTAKVWIADYVSQNSLLPISQVQGFTQFVAQTDKILTAQTTTSTSYADLTTAGPEVTGLSAGQYLFLYGFTGGGVGSGIISYASPSFNGDTPSSDDLIEVFSGPGPSFGSYSVMGSTLKTLTENNNSAKLQYQTSSGTSSFEKRWLTALRVGNP
jgi:hypothetical protein